MDKPEVNKIYRCTRSYTHPNLGKMLTKGKDYKCIRIDSKNDIIAMVADNPKYAGVNCSKQFFTEHFVDASKPVVKTKTLKLTQREADWLKYFFSKYINDIADLDGGTDYESLMTVSDKIEKF